MLAVVIGIAVGGSIFFIKILRSQWKCFADAKAQLTKQGYQTDFEIKPLLAIDSKAWKIIFLDPMGGFYDLYGFSDIVHWGHQWVNKANTVQNIWDGRIKYLKDSKVSNVLVFQTKNPHQPLYKITLLGHEIGENWMAKLTAMMNG